MNRRIGGGSDIMKKDKRNEGGKSRLISRRDFAHGAATVMGAGAIAQATAALDDLPEEAKAVKIEKSSEIAAHMEEWIITDDDIRRVIANAEKTGRKLYQPDSDHFLSKLRIGQVYFYVEYSKTGDSTYKIHTTWSHRFVMLKEPY